MPTSEATDMSDVVFICDGGAAFEERRIMFCWTENRRRRFVVRSQAWYGATLTCLGCGDSWSDGERGYRPFARGWRQKAIADATKRWNAITLRAPERRAAFHAWLEAQPA